MEWQPIETAPKDGTDILVYNKVSNEQFAVFYDSGHWRFSELHSLPAENVTHWMPLPQPPKLMTEE